MTPQEQINLGYSQIRAAVVGGHDIVQAWLELATMLHNGKTPHVIHGALGCLLFCIAALEKVEPLPKFLDERLNQILQGGHAARLAAFAITKDAEELNYLVASMAVMVQSRIERFSFTGNVPSVAPAVNPR